MEEQKTESQTPPPAHHNGGLKSPDDSFHSGSRTNGIRREKWPFLVIAVLLVLVGIFGGYFVMNQTKQSQTSGPTPTLSEQTQTENLPSPEPTSSENPETADWKLYTNSESGYSIKYPGDLYVRLICPGEELTLRTKTAKDTKDVETFETCGRGGRFTIEVVTSTSFTEPVTDDYISVVKSEIEVAAVAGRKYISTKKPGAEGPIPDWSEDIYFENNGKKHLIHFDQGVSTDLKTNILSTFKFL